MRTRAESASRLIAIDLEDRHVPPQRPRIEVALRVADERPERGRRRRAIDLMATGEEERHVRLYVALRPAAGRVQLEHGVHALEHLRSVRAKSLVWRRHRLLVPVVGEP